jgi:hypothetical protein
MGIFSTLFRQKPFGDENKWISWTVRDFLIFSSLLSKVKMILSGKIYLAEFLAQINRVERFLHFEWAEKSCRLGGEVERV